MQLNGGYRFFFSDAICKRHNIESEIYIPNSVVAIGKEQFLRAVTRDEDMGLTGTPFLYYVGLCNQAPADADTLASITTEPTAAGGYARISFERNSTGWPTVDEVSGQKRASSKVLTFTASGAAYSTSFTRAFLCSVASGTVGNLFSYSGALTVPVTLLDGDSFQMQYELYFR